MPFTLYLPCRHVSELLHRLQSAQHQGWRNNAAGMPKRPPIIRSIFELLLLLDALNRARWNTELKASTIQYYTQESNPTAIAGPVLIHGD
jgi:hypothetical protein